MQPIEDSEPESRPSALRRFGPVTAVLVVIALVAGFSLVGGGGGDDDASTDDSAAAQAGDLPEGVVTWSMAQADDIDAQFPDTCDTESGMVAIPFFFRTECIADVDGDNGGATAPGVTGDEITVVAWLPNDDDPIFALVRQALGIDESVDDVRETYEGLVEIFQAHYQTYGRTVNLEFVQASGTMLDPVAARADAVRAADMQPFAVLGGPLLANAWTEELHARGIVCMACPGTSDPAPTSFGILPSTGQIRDHVVEYVSTKLAGKPAEFAGDDLKEDERVFGLLYLAQSDSDEGHADRMVDELADQGVDVAETFTYPLDPGRAQELSASAIARFKDAGVTSVILRADPITAPAFTNEATEQNWFPEWVLGGFQFTDATTFARGFDQQQWEHAFGVSFMPPLAPPAVTPAYRLYEWYFGEPPAADNALILIYPQVALFLTGVEYAGPDLTPEHLRDGLFAFPPTPSAVTQPSVDYREVEGKGADNDDYAGIDDMVELWWDADATGTDETGEEGQGMYRYVDGGKRYYLGDWPDELNVFDEEGSVTSITDPPPAEVPPDYPSPADS